MHGVQECLARGADKSALPQPSRGQQGGIQGLAGLVPRGGRQYGELVLDAAAVRGAMREPSTATPRAPPSWRTVLFIAEATPAFSRGIAFMMDTAAVGMTHATPAPSAANRTRISHTGACWVTKVTPQSDAVTASMPAAHTFRGPIERTRTVLSGPQTTFATASATVHPPACRGV